MLCRVSHDTSVCLLLTWPPCRLCGPEVSFELGTDYFLATLCSNLSFRVSLRTDAHSAKRQRREELKRAAEWENATGVIKGSQAALDKEVNCGVCDF